MGSKEIFGLSKSVWSMTFRMLAKYPCLLLPFFITALFEGLALAILFYFPRSPLSIIFAPIVKAFFGEKFLHYPNNFLILPRLFYISQMLVAMTVGVSMFGMAMGMVYQANMGENEVKISGNLNRSLRRYASLVCIWLVMFILPLIILRVPRILAAKFLPPGIFAAILSEALFYTGIILVFLTETLFIYAYPAVIIERNRFFGAVKRSFEISRRIFLTTVVLVVAPRVLDVAVMILKRNMLRLMNSTVPEVIVVIVAASIAATFITDALVFLATANLFALARETEKEAT